jgi:glutamate-5-semialdehyde dehydrogenase
VDLIVARGSSEFVQHVQQSTRIPVMGHAAGVCHLYLHAAAEPAMAARVAVDAKCSYPAACNSIEALLWDPGAGAALDAAVAALTAAGVELRGCPQSRARHPSMKPAGDGDWGHEFGALVLAVRQVAGMDEALAFIARYGSRHTEAIVTADRTAAERFLTAVDAGSVFHNASNRFADGFRYGLGAEVGVSTDKLHARGPVGVEGLLTYRWLLRGDGQVTTAYGAGGRRYTHRDLKS